MSFSMSEYKNSLDGLQPFEVTAMETEGRVCCCMCGDVGFSEDLLQCPVCRFRVQHKYCSLMYPEIDVSRWKCEWCLHDSQQKLQERQQQESSTPKKHKEGKYVPKEIISTTKKLLRKGGDADGSDSCRQWNPKCIQSPRRRYKLLSDVLMG